MYAGEVIDGQTVRAIVGTAEWAIANLGGEWHDSELKIQVPGTWDELNGFQAISLPPPEPEPDVV